MNKPIGKALQWIGQGTKRVNTHKLKKSIIKLYKGFDMEHIDLQMNP